jgi:hypothetical protein
MRGVCLSIWLIVAAVTSAEYWAAPPRQSSTSSADPEVDQIYELIVDWRIAHPGEGNTPQQLVFLDASVPYSCFPAKEDEGCPSQIKKRVQFAFPGKLDDQAVDNYLEQNRTTSSISTSFRTSLPKVFISSADQNRLFSKEHDGWKIFYAKYPKAGGIISFSKIGFNHDHNAAILYSAVGCGWLCGTGYYHLLKKQSGKWVIVGHSMVWIS